MDTTNPAAATAAPSPAPGASSARCATCGTRFPPRHDGHLYCCRECRRFAARLFELRDMADSIIGASASANQGRALYRMRRMLAAAAAGTPLPDASCKHDRHRTCGSDRPRRWCSVCGADLGDRKGRGRPPVSCPPSSDRTCARFRNKAQEMRTFGNTIAKRAEGGADKARRAMLATVAEVNREIGIGII